RESGPDMPVTDPVPVRGSLGIVLDDHVAARGKLPEDGRGGVRLQVKQDAPLAPVDDAMRGHPAVRRVDLDHVRAILAEDPPAAWTGENLREVEDPQSFEGPGNVLSRPGGGGSGGWVAGFPGDPILIGVRPPAGRGGPTRGGGRGSRGAPQPVVAQHGD